MTYTAEDHDWFPDLEPRAHDARRALGAAGRAAPVRVGAEDGGVGGLPALGVRERRARPGVAPERPFARRCGEARLPPGPVRRLDARRRVRLAGAQPRARAEARSGERLGQAVHGASRGDRSRARPRLQGVLHGHARRRRAGPCAVSRRRRALSRRRAGGRVPRRRVRSGVAGAGGKDELRRADPLGGGRARCRWSRAG